MKLGLILVLVALLVPTVGWLVFGERGDIVLPERPGWMGLDPRLPRRPSATIPLRHVFAGSAVCAAIGVYLLATRKPR